MENKKALSEVLTERLDQLQKEIEALKPQKSSMTSTVEEKGHKDIEDLLACPNCRSKVVEKLKPDLEKEVRNRFREEAKAFKKPRLCSDCGELLDGSTNPECPNCHGHHY